MTEGSLCSLAFRVDGKANRPELHGKDRVVSVPTVRCGGQADHIAGLDLREHTLERDCWYDDLTIALHNVGDSPLTNKALDHRHVKIPIWLVFTSTDLADLFLFDSEKHGELGSPLVQKRLAMNQHERVPPALRHEVGTQHGLADTGRCDEHADVVKEKRSRGLPRKTFWIMTRM